MLKKILGDAVSYIKWMPLMLELEFKSHLYYLSIDMSVVKQEKLVKDIAIYQLAPTFEWPKVTLTPDTWVLDLSEYSSSIM